MERERPLAGSEVEGRGPGGGVSGLHSSSGYNASGVASLHVILPHVEMTCQLLLNYTRHLDQSAPAPALINPVYRGDERPSGRRAPCEGEQKDREIGRAAGRERG